jgi:selenium metabolism protein YedF
MIDGLYHITITKKENSNCDVMDLKEGKGPVILVSSDKFGSGDDKLGAVLMKSYMFALSESDVKPETMLFANGGVKLTCEGSDVLESLKSLQENGVEMLSCGTCLDFYGLKEKLSIGNITNMYTIVEKMNKSGNAIRI